MSCPISFIHGADRLLPNPNTGHMTKTQDIMAYLTANPEAAVADVAKKFKAHRVTVYQIRGKMRKAGAGGDGAGSSSAKAGGPKARRRGRRARAGASATAIASLPRAVRSRSRSERDNGDADILGRLKLEYDSLGQLIALLENPTAREVLNRVTASA